MSTLPAAAPAEFLWSSEFYRYLGVPITSIGLIFGLSWIRKLLKRPKDIRHKVVLITGASSGVGEALAHCFYKQGCKVILAARRESELNRVKNNLLNDKGENQTYEPLVVSLDLASTSSCSEAIEKAYKIYGHIDILINNGGISCRGDVLSTDLDVHLKLMQVNYFGPVFLTREVLPKMVAKGSGHIVFVSSIQGRIGIPFRSSYAASKHACQAFADTLRAEVHQHNIEISVISPAYIKTALSINALTGSGQQYGVMDKTTESGYSPEFVANNILNMVLFSQNDKVLAPFTYRMAILLRCLLPDVYFWIMRNRALKESKKD